MRLRTCVVRRFLPARSPAKAPDPPFWCQGCGAKGTVSPPVVTMQFTVAFVVVKRERRLRVTCRRCGWRTYIQTWDLSQGQEGTVAQTVAIEDRG
jgi:transcription elongation factor Elf1